MEKKAEGRQKKKITYDLKRFAVQNKAKDQDLDLQEEEEDNSVEKETAEKSLDMEVFKTFFSTEAEILKTKLPIWKWLVLVAVIVLFSLIFYVLGSYFSRGKIVMAAVHSSDSLVAGKSDELRFESGFGFSPPENTEVEIFARGVVVMDRQTGAILLEQDKDSVLPAASLTKIVTARIALQHWEFDDILTLTAEVDPEAESSAGLVKGEEYIVQDLVTALLVSSSGEAGYTLADAYPGGREAFVAQMNNWVDELGVENTNFVDPVGLNVQNQSTAYELAQITRVVLCNGTIREMVNMRKVEICSLSGVCIELENTNELLAEDENNFFGVKTGYTIAAGPCLIAGYKEKGADLIVVLLNANDKFETANDLVRLLL